MTTTQSQRVEDEFAELATDDGVPVGLEWAGEAWTVTDRPTRLLRDAAWFVPWVMHQPTVFVGWRFQARSDSGRVLVIDVLRKDGGWRVAHVWE